MMSFVCGCWWFFVSSVRFAGLFVAYLSFFCAYTLIPPLGNTPLFCRITCSQTTLLENIQKWACISYRRYRREADSKDSSIHTSNLNGTKPKPATTKTTRKIDKKLREGKDIMMMLLTILLRIFPPSHSLSLYFSVNS